MLLERLYAIFLGISFVRLKLNSWRIPALFSQGLRNVVDSFRVYTEVQL